MGALASSCPAITTLLPSCRIAVNNAFASPDTPVRGTDEVAVIPPVSGG
ncbi:MAG: MoaD/ThiS family protein [Cyanobacteria bacterium REEB65]|nr:MoaD/ThiS family protein [Cyanobacteria bacterium REEB65]